ncbi:hypothetical protein LF1_47930 [Rubripirellula obstinata]|uniref:Uncharacterized protein n=1 Tax=Rubripirellula obstinata TaxID=406547 RepID=A0A5B1CPQ4_9BACT|nr:hypothetical protein LF1_47930 [Rubripirellula obstinata]
MLAAFVVVGMEPQRHRGTQSLVRSSTGLWVSREWNHRGTEEHRVWCGRALASGFLGNGTTEAQRNTEEHRVWCGRALASGFLFSGFLFSGILSSVFLCASVVQTPSPKNKKASLVKEQGLVVGLGLRDANYSSSSVSTNSGQGTSLLFPRGVNVAWYTR